MIDARKSDFCPGRMADDDEQLKSGSGRDLSCLSHCHIGIDDFRLFGVRKD